MKKQSSHVDEQTTPWVDGLTMSEVLEQTAQRFADHDALVFPHLDYRASYGQFAADVELAARGLVALGIKPGEHVAIWATNVPEWVVLQFAAARAGAVLVNINPAYRPFELKYVLNQSDSVALFLVAQFKSSDYFAMLAEVCPELATCQPGQLLAADFPKLRHVVALEEQAPAGGITWSHMLAQAEKIPPRAVEAIARELTADLPVNIQYTSGTTGFPKAAMLSHRNLLLNGYYSGLCQNLTADDRVCIPVPFYHCFGCVLGTIASVVHGSAMIVPAESFNPEATLDAIERERATALYGVPTMFIAELQDSTFSGRDLRSLRTGIMAGSPCPIEVMRQVIDPMGARGMTIGYGLTEASPLITQSRSSDPIELRVETVGRVLPGVESKIVDPATGRTLGDNEQGELCARGHGIMLGYYKNPEATAASIDPEGWLHSGDLAVRLPNGYYRITGRIKDMVIRGGENIYPREIEEFLFEHPAVEQAAVVGVPDPKYGEELCAWLKLKAGCECTVDEIRSFCQVNLARYKVPRYVKFVDAFPQTVTGKIQKFKIRELMIAEHDLAEQETA
ncbi:MAG TPA: AMP-binding protein [Pirellulales bacterium]|jgi:fatty-acyl-CoA synthase